MTNRTAVLTAGQTVTLDVLGAWHYGLTGTVTSVDTVREQVTVRFTGHGSMTVPSAVVLPA